MTVKRVFDDLQFKCCKDIYENCRCGINESFLRRYALGEKLRPMNLFERDWCTNECLHSCEEYYTQESLIELPDKELAAMVLKSWEMYVYKNHIQRSD